MRIRLPLGRTLFFLGAFLLSLVALLPMRLAVDWLGLPERGLAAREAEGSLWLGGFGEAQYGGIALGDVHARLRRLPLLLGRARIDLSRPAGAEGDGFRGALTVTRHGLGMDDLSGRLAVAGAFGALPVSQIDLDRVTVHFQEGGCVHAEGNVRAAVAGDLGGIALPGGLTGAARCDAGALLLPLSSQSGMESVELRLHGDGRYQARLIVRSADAAAAPAVAAAGFAPVEGGYARMIEGRF